MRGKVRYSYSYTGIHQFQTDLDVGGSVTVNRHFLRLNAVRPANRNLMIGLGLSYDYERWDFDNVADIAGASPWDRIHRIGLSLPLLYAPSAEWRFAAIPTIELAGTPDAKWEESLSYGAILNAMKVFSPRLSLGLGAGLYNQMEEVTAFPFIAVKWRINDDLLLQNPFKAGPAGPAGLELVLFPDRAWSFATGGGYRSYRFRLDDGGDVPNGIGQNRFTVLFVRVARSISPLITLDLSAGALLNGELSVENDNHHKVGSTDYDTAPIVALTVSGRF